MIEISELLKDNTLISIYFLKASLLLVGTYVLTLLWKNTSAAMKANAWRAGIIGLFLLPIFCLIVPQWQLVNQVQHKSAQNEQSAPAPVQPPPHAQRIKPVIEKSEKLKSDKKAEVQPASGLTISELPYSNIFLLVWLIGVFTLLARWANDCRLIHQLLSQGVAFENQVADQIIDTYASSRRGAKNVRVIESPVITGPMTVGIFRPVILVPRIAHQWPEEQLKATLLHELAHIKRSDYLTYVCAQITCIVYWMNPLTWIAKSKLRLEQEKACDDAVIRDGIQSVDYAEHLVSIARWAVLEGARTKTYSRGAIGMAKEHMLKKRMRAILHAGTPRASLSGWKKLGSVLIVICLMVPIAALSFETAELDEVYLWYEAEEAALDGDMIIKSDEETSGFRYVEANIEESDEDMSSAGGLTIRFNVSEAGEYVIWGRVLAPSRRQNSFYVVVDDGEKVVWDTQGPDKEMTAQVWSWDRVRNREASSNVEGGDPIAFYFDEGWHTLRLLGRERGTGLDRILITNNLIYRPRSRGIAVESAVDYVWIEPEDGRIVQPMEKGIDASASERNYVWTPEEKENIDGDGFVRMRFYVERDGDYVVWGRVLAPTRSENSFFIRVDDGDELLWDVYGPDKDNTAQAWWWDRARDRKLQGEANSDTLVFSLKKGWHSMVLRNREAGTQMDRILVTNDKQFVPEGWGTSPKELSPVHLWMEAEDADLKPPLQIGWDSGASNGAFIEVTGERQSTSKPPSDGHANFYVEVPISGTYLLWGRVLAPSNGDSFWLRINGQRWIRWNGIQKGSGWHWEEVHDNMYNNRVLSLELQAGTHLIELAYREKDTKLDGLLLTNDMNYVPASMLDESVVQKREALVSAFRN